MKKANIAVLVSGGGTNLQAILDAEARGEIPDGKVTLVISDRAGAYALERARKAGVPALEINKKACGGQAAFEEKLTEALELVELDVHGYLHNGLDDACNTARMIAKLETNRDYRTLIERVREKETEQTPLTVSLGSFLQGLDLEPA